MVRFSKFQFHKVRLKEFNLEFLITQEEFQFHKVRLKVNKMQNVGETNAFQFHKVRLKVLHQVKSFMPQKSFNSIRYD